MNKTTSEQKARVYLEQRKRRREKEQDQIPDKKITIIALGIIAALFYLIVL